MCIFFFEICKKNRFLGDFSGVGCRGVAQSASLEDARGGELQFRGERWGIPEYYSGVMNTEKWESMQWAVAPNQLQTNDLVCDAYGAFVVAFGHGVIDNHIVILW